MHDAAFARAAVPAPIAILGLPLRPYALGHSIWLAAAGNPLALEEPDIGEVKAHHILEAIWTCASRWRELAAQHARYLTLAKLRFWRRRASRGDLAGAAAAFAEYRRLGASVPPMRSADGQGRLLGAPVAATLAQFLVDRLGKTEEEAMDYPLGLAYWHFATYQERQGELRILNAGEVEFETWCEAQERKKEGQVKYA